MGIEVVRDRPGLASLPAAPTAVVMTMGALHEGHGSLIALARERVGVHGRIVVTVFVNPKQFGAGEDFERYPRTLEADVELCERSGADAVYAPSMADVYGTDDRSALTEQVLVDPGPLGALLEGAARPGHFAGALTVIAKLLHITGASVTVFGEKDYQQLVLVQRMVRDLDFGVEVLPGPTRREADGLAMSSRNRYLSPEERAAASTIPVALAAGVAAARSGAQPAIDAVLAALSPDLRPDYVVVRAPDLGEPPAGGRARILLAAHAGTTRLIDNMACELR